MYQKRMKYLYTLVYWCMLKGTGHLMALKNTVEYMKQKGIPLYKSILSVHFFCHVYTFDGRANYAD
jgi:hypothetical protein